MALHGCGRRRGIGVDLSNRYGGAPADEEHVVGQSTTESRRCHGDCRTSNPLRFQCTYAQPFTNPPTSLAAGATLAPSATRRQVHDCRTTVSNVGLQVGKGTDLSSTRSRPVSLAACPSSSEGRRTQGHMRTRTNRLQASAPNAPKAAPVDQATRERGPSASAAAA